MERPVRNTWLPLFLQYGWCIAKYNKTVRFCFNRSLLSCILSRLSVAVYQPGVVVANGVPRVGIPLFVYIADLHSHFLAYDKATLCMDPFNCFVSWLQTSECIFCYPFLQQFQTNENQGQLAHRRLECWQHVRIEQQYRYAKT